MKLNNIEKTINLYLDGQLTPVQREEMEKLIESDRDVRVLFEQLRQTDAMIKSAAAAFDESREDSFEAIYSQARDSVAARHTSLRWSSVLRFGAGIAAGLLIAAGLFYLYTASSQSMTPEWKQIAQGDQQDDLISDDVHRASACQKEVRPLVHDVDLYYYKDDNGNEWLIEGIRHEVVKQASAGGKL